MSDHATESPPWRIVGTFQRFTRSETASGRVLLACTGLALAWANSPWSDRYVTLVHQSILLGGSHFAVDLTVQEWINDALMAVFFFLVGLEIKRELLVGELASPRRAALPIAGALGGMVVPALLYSAINASGTGARGWGIPMATDIAFALGVVALIGSRISHALKVFLSAVAIVDDIGAVLVIALFYTASIRWTGLVIAAVVLGALSILNRAGVRHALPYLLLGVVLWIAILLSGVHSTVAGVLLALTIPARSRSADEVPLLERLEDHLHTPVAFVIVPLFALANAGVRISSGTSSGHAFAVMCGVIVGLVIGKPLGITVAAWIAVRLRAAELPAGVNWRALQGVSCLGGIGFTMSLFVGALAFTDAALLDSAKIGVLIASCIAASVGWLAFRRPGTETQTPLPSADGATT